MASILNGTIARDSIIAKLAQDVGTLSFVPSLVIMQVGERPDSNSYINQKKKLAEKIGVAVIHKRYSDQVSQEELLNDIDSFNKDPKINGIIVQLPIPQHLDKQVLIEAIDPLKDVDGLTSYNTKFLYDNHPGGIMPATARGILELLSYYGIDVTGKQIAVMGRSSLVGRPVALALLNKNASVTVIHSMTPNPRELVKAADIVIVAIGKAEYVDKAFIKPGQIIIDVGINAVPEGSIADAPKRTMVGDVKFKEVEPIVDAISPVPGGVGPMTVISLFKNLFDACTLQHKR